MILCLSCLFRFQGDGLPGDLSSPMALSAVVDALIAQHFSCEDGTKDFQAVYM